MRREAKYELSLGDDRAVLRRRGSRAFTTARILGRETSDEGLERIWLDRVVAPYGVETSDGWIIKGAVTSILYRQMSGQVG